MTKLLKWIYRLGYERGVQDSINTARKATLLEVTNPFEEKKRTKAAEEAYRDGVRQMKDKILSNLGDMLERDIWDV